VSALWTSDEIAKATGGTALSSFKATGLSIDSRSTKPGDLFVPLVAERDGHDFIQKAMAAGAAGVLTAKPVDGPAVQVTDTMVALEALGKVGRDRSQAERIAVTGSVGKTSVKDALAVMFAALGSTHKSQRSFNNHLGVPITLATLPKETEFAVFETGMNHAGELTALSKQVAPHVALITTVAGAHRENFESIEAIADAKAEIRHGLVDGGTLILNADNAYTSRIIAQSDGLNIFTFGESGDIQIVSSSSQASGGSVHLDVAGQEIAVTHNLSGAHWASNIAACIAVAHALGQDVKACADALSSAKESEGRGDTHRVSVAGKDITLIDQSYNANPASMRAAIAAAALHEGRKLALLGDMKELGADELDQHAALATPLVAAEFSRVLTVGECMRALRGALPRAYRAAHADDAEGIADALQDELQDGDVLLIKGSNATGLGALARRLKAGEG
jgi:UDP-N-acetylmuramoyl-tripeptide--D-alanyl-D-alanine ligase